MGRDNLNMSPSIRFIFRSFGGSLQSQAETAVHIPCAGNDSTHAPDMLKLQQQATREPVPHIYRITSIEKPPPNSQGPDPENSLRINPPSFQRLKNGGIS